MIKLFDISISSLEKKNITNKIDKIIDKTSFIMGQEVKELENNLSSMFDSRSVISCANGTDALSLSLMALGLTKNSTVFVTNYSYISTAEVILLNNLKPCFVDIELENFNICPNSLEKMIKNSLKKKKKISAIISVDLYGAPANHLLISKLAKKYNLKYIIDGAQGLGCKIKGKFSNYYSDIYTTSFFPTKPLGCFGDGGAIFTNNLKISKKINSLKFHGKGKNKNDHIAVGLNSRLDTIQAIILNEKLKNFQNKTLIRKKIANEYLKKIDNPQVVLPKYEKNFDSVFSLFTLKVKKRKKFINFLKKNQIQTGIYYDKVFTDQKVFKKFDQRKLINSQKISKTSVSIPCHDKLTSKEVKKIIKVINSFV